MEIVSSMVGKIMEYTIEPIGRQLKYVCFMRHNIRNLTSEVEKLKHTKESVEHKVSKARRNADNIESGVQTWLTKVDAIIEKSETIMQNNQAQQLRLCFNFVQRHQSSRKALKLADEVLQLKNEGQFDSVSYTPPLSEVESSRAKTSNFLDFESRKSTIEEIIRALMDDNINTIGVYGMGGVGKTMLVKEISRIVKKKNLFDEVVTLTISQTPNLKTIQEELADKLGLSFKEKTTEGRALKLKERLKIEKSILVVLDDVWKHIDLETIGILSIEDHTGCKILFTSRDESVLNDMYTDENFGVKVLQEDETWNLFKTMTGEIVETSDFKTIAVEIAKECAHLPIAITTVAKALRKKESLSIWQDALDQLRNPMVVNIRGIHEKVYSSLKLSYEQLDCEEAKLLFLLCSMFPEDYSICVEEQLHVYAMGMGFLRGVDTMAQARRRVTKLVDDLISSSLLLEEPEEECRRYVKMHDIVRDVAILISSKDDRVCTLSYSKGLDESWPENKISGDHTAVYLDIKDMIGELNELEILSFEDSNIIQIPMTMSQLTQLKVLDLSKCSLEVIPPNILLNLTKLEELYLGSFSGWEGEELNEGRRNASLSELSYLSHLYALELWIPDENILPKQLFSRRLDLKKFYICVGCGECRSWENKFSRVLCLKMEGEGCMNNGIKMLLKRSEELNLEGSIGARVFQFELNTIDFSDLKDLYIRDDSEIQHLIHERKKPLQKALSKLEFLQLQNLENLESLFRSHVRESPINNFILNDILHVKVIKIFDCKMMKAIVVLGSKMTTHKLEFTNLRSLKLHGLPRLQTFFYEIEKFGDSSLDDLKKDEMRRFDNDDSFFNQEVSFPKLEQLEFAQAHNLKIMCRNILCPNSFCKLKNLWIVKCDNLETIFSSNILSRLTCLKSLHIESCKLLEKVFEVQEPNLTNKDIDFLPNLRDLSLEELPSLQYIWEKNSCQLLNLKNLKNMYIRKCPKLEYSVKVIQVEMLTIDFSGLKGILRKDNSMQMSGLDEFETSKDGPKLFSKLKYLKLYGCYDHRQTDLPMEFVQVIQNLEVFEVSKTLFEEVFPIERLVVNVEEQQNDGFKISYLKLYDLPKLKHLWSGDSQKNSSIFQNLVGLHVYRCGITNMFLMPSSMSLRNLNNLSVVECPKLNSLLNPSVARTLVKLQSLEIVKCKRMTTIIDGRVEEEDDEVLFNKLYWLKIDDLPNLTSFHSGKCTITFPNLNRIRITNCPDMRTFSLGIVSMPYLPTKNIVCYGNHWKWISISKYSKEIIVKDINVIIQQVWEDNYDTAIKFLFKEQNLEEKQCDHSSHVEELESE